MRSGCREAIVSRLGPTTYLDLTHQIEILDLLFELNEQEHRTIVMLVKIPEPILWENIFVYIEWMYLELIHETKDSKLKMRLSEDFRFISSEVIGSTSYREKKGMRRTCCLAYLTTTRSAHCKSCPISCTFVCKNSVTSSRKIMANSNKPPIPERD